MTEELKQAAQQVVEAWDACGRCPDAMAKMDRLEDAINALRAAISQAQGGKAGEAGAWSPALTYPGYERERVWANGKPRQEDIDYWQKNGNGITYAYTHPAPGVPEGWKLVPAVPTPEMVSAALRECGGIGGGSCGEHTGVDGSDFVWVWETMLAAAPAQKGADHG